MQLHRIIFTNVQELVNRHDPVGLVEGGAPDDEYSAEVGKIVSILRQEVEASSLAEKIHQVFRDSFGDNIKVEKHLYLILATELLQLKKRLRW